MCSHLFSLHPSIWEIVENRMHFDSTDNPVFINEQIHKNAQATTVLLASLLSHPVLEGKPNANYVRARIRTHVHSDYINEHHHTMLE
jgi:hypothetical protein